MGNRLDRDQVVRTALLVLNEEGLEGLTLRRIAKDLNVQAPALYWHFKHKRDLLDAMATEMMRRMSEGFVNEPADWREVLTETQRAFRGALLRYRDGGKVFSGTRFTDTSYAPPMEAHLRRLVGLGLTPRAATRATFTANCYTVGYVIEEQAMGPDPGRGESDGHGYDLEARARRLADYPLTAEAGFELFGDPDAGYEAGLRAIVAGIEATLTTVG
ncbi:TetR/AcrR family transcriptional regulator C-terminal domain-containing protein [Streptomyces sp. NPDC052396]|uniref:TetR/AcrR family transcriptional regulator C-terminal domain-containing protein n=1 Tax=Streptomyces sp. NPDC052396 TaxID=3365689 RepID=UPI0037D5C123